MYKSSLQPKFSSKFYKVETFKTKSHAQEIKSMGLKIYDSQDSNICSDTFFSSTNYQLCREECRPLVNGIKEFLHENSNRLTPPLSEIKISELNQHLTTLENNLCDGNVDYFAPHKETIYGEGKATLAELLVLLKKEDIPINKRMSALINAAPTMSLCSGGLMTALHEAVSSLKYSTAGLRGAAQRIKTQMIEHLIAEHIKNEDYRYSIGSEIHLINTHFNKLATELGTQPRKDDFTCLFENQISPNKLEQCKAEIKHGLRPDTLSSAMAQNYLDIIASEQKHDLAGPAQDTDNGNIINQISQATNKLEAEFGTPPLLTTILRATDETYQSFNFTRQPALIAKHFIERLTDDGLINNYKEITLTEDHGEGVVKQIGNIFWRQRHKNDCEEIKPEELIAASPHEILQSLEKQNISIEDQTCILIEIAKTAYNSSHPNFPFDNADSWFSSLKKSILLSHETEGFPALHIASLLDSNKGISELLSAGVNVDALDDGSNTPLIIASKNNSLHAIEELLRHGCDVSHQNNNGDTALIISAGNPQGAPSVETLLAFLAPTHITNLKNENAFTRAASTGSLESVRLLIEVPSSVDTNKPFKGQSSSTIRGLIHCQKVASLINRLDSSGKSMMHCAAMNGRAEILKFLVWAGGDVNIKDYKGSTPLFTALIFRQRHLIEPLLNARAIVTDEVHFAAYDNDVDFLRLLGNYGFNLHRPSSYHHTGIMAASKYGSILVLEYLIQSASLYDINASVQTGELKGHTALSMATEANQPNAAALLISSGAEYHPLVRHLAVHGKTQDLEFLRVAGANLSRGSSTGYSPLMLAASEGLLDTVKYLCSHLSIDEINAQITRPTQNQGFTALHFSILKPAVDVATFLIQSGAESGQLVIQTAMTGTTQTLQHLKEAGANFTQRDPSGFTALMAATIKRRLDVVQYLCSILSLDDINATTGDAQLAKPITALSLARTAQRSDIADLLIKAGAYTHMPKS